MLKMKEGSQTQRTKYHTITCALRDIVLYMVILHIMQDYCLTSGKLWISVQYSSVEPCLLEVWIEILGIPYHNTKSV